MGRCCRICDRVRSNESFSGGGHKNCICKKCQKLPKEELNLIRVKDELLGYWNQSSISKLNIKRLDQLKHFPSEEIQELAHLTFLMSLQSHAFTQFLRNRWEKTTIKWRKGAQLALS